MSCVVVRLANRASLPCVARRLQVPQSSGVGRASPDRRAAKRRGWTEPCRPAGRSRKDFLLRPTLHYLLTYLLTCLLSPTLHSVSSFFLSFFLFKRLSARRDKAEIRGEKVSTTETSGLINRAFFARELYVLRSRETIFIIVDEFRISKNKKR